MSSIPHLSVHPLPHPHLGPPLEREDEDCAASNDAAQVCESIHLHVRRFNDLGPSRDFIAEFRAGLIRRQADWLCTGAEQIRGGVGCAEYRSEFTIETIDDGLGRARGRKETMPAFGFEA